MLHKMIKGLIQEKIIEGFEGFAIKFFKENYADHGGKLPTTLVTLITKGEDETGLGVVAMPGISLVGEEGMQTLKKEVLPRLSCELEIHDSKPICIAWAKRVVKKVLKEGGDENNPEDFIKQRALLILVESADKVTYKCFEMFVGDTVEIDQEGDMKKSVTYYGKELELTQESIYEKRFERLFKSV